MPPIFPSPIALPAGWCLHHERSVGSTNDAATALALEGASEGTVLWADQQTAGRGRSGRDWTSPEGNLYCSVIVRPGADLCAAANLSFVIAIALRAGIEQVFSAARPRLKWPNDILAGGAKLSGILLETGQGSAGAHVIAGTGVNIAHAPQDTPYPAARLADFGDGDPAALLAAYLAALADRLALWHRDGFEPIRREWLDHCIGLGQPVTVRAGGQAQHGVFEALDARGALILRRAGGDASAILAADVFFHEMAQGGSA